MAQTSGQVLNQDLNIHYQTTGEGPPMVLVHGWGADCQSNWVDSGWVATLSQLRTLICIDVRGHGRSDKPYALAPYSYAAMSTDVLAVMDHLGIEQADYMGYSMGAFMGAWLLGHHSQRFGAMVLGGIGDESEESAAQGAQIATALRATSAADLHPYAQAVREFAAANPRNDLNALAYSAAQMWSEGYPLKLAGPGLSQARTRVLIVNGDQDLPYVLTAQALTDAIPDATYQSIAGHDHLTVVADPTFKSLVADFLRTGN